MTYQIDIEQSSDYSDYLILKILFDFKLFDQVFKDYHRNCDLINYLGFLEDPNEEKDTIKKIRIELKNRYVKLRHSFSISHSSQIAYNNLLFIKQLLNLNDTELELVRLSYHINDHKALEEAIDLLGRVDLSKSITILAKLLDLNVVDIKKALNKQGKLLQFDIISRSFSPDRVDEFLQWGDFIDFSDFGLTELNGQVFIGKYNAKIENTTLQLSDFEHISELRNICLDYLKNAINKKKKGSHIFIYGLPGTGKTEFASLLARELKLDAYKISYMDDDGDLISGKKRLENCQIMQRVLNNNNELIVFDEVEDVFSSSIFEQSVAQSHKAWFNDLLEKNSIPMIWISNRIDGIDPAFLRRFDLIFEMPNLPTENKEKLIRELAKGKLDENYIKYFSTINELTPAVLQRTFNVASELVEQSEQYDFLQQLMKLFNNALQAQGKQEIEPLKQEKLAYNLDWVSCKTNLHKITEGLKETKQARICCYGPAGTGKTAWANWIAEQLNMPALVKKGSDILGKYVGENEQNIAKAFKQAKQQNAVLIFDEVDSFLFSRSPEQNSWQHSLVNEMLTQIEKFEGVLIVSTNLMNELDKAALRRFDLKLYFDFLTPEQSQEISIAQAEKFNLPLLTEMELNKIKKLSNLTTGDFVAISRRHRFAKFENNQEWITSLEEECNLKQESNSRKIGF